MILATFQNSLKTEFVHESTDGKKMFDITIKRDI